MSCSSREHTEVKFKGNKRQSKTPREAEVSETEETVDGAEGCLFLWR